MNLLPVSAAGHGNHNLDPCIVLSLGKSLTNGFQGKEGQTVPEMTPEIVSSITDRYIELYEHITGEKFVKAEESRNVLDRICGNVTKCLAALK